MKRKITIALCILMVMVVGCANIEKAAQPITSPEVEKTPEPTGTMVSSPSPYYTPSPSSVYTPTPSTTEITASLDSGKIDSPDLYDLEFSDLAELDFWFGSGAGAWSTTLKIHPDGTFNGYYHDSEAGSIGDDYPHGTRYECYFSGNFTSLKKIGDYEYSMKCESLVTEGVVGEEKIEDNIKIITAEPYGFDNADEFLLYLPGKKLNELPEGFLNWANIGIDSKSDVLTIYGLYNVGGEQGFITSL